uniref:Uncharacterized protein n=1 Tax=Arundo donax TaxID=35708 RepID=A0A0A9EG18_ARUDO
MLSSIIPQNLNLKYNVYMEKKKDKFC